MTSSDSTGLAEQLKHQNLKDAWAQFRRRHRATLVLWVGILPFFYGAWALTDWAVTGPVGLIPIVAYVVVFGRQLLKLDSYVCPACFERFFDRYGLRVRNALRPICQACGASPWDRSDVRRPMTALLADQATLKAAGIAAAIQHRRLLVSRAECDAASRALLDAGFVLQRIDLWEEDDDSLLVVSGYHLLATSFTDAKALSLAVLAAPERFTHVELVGYYAKREPRAAT